VLPAQVRKLGKVAGYDRVGRSLVRKRLGKVIRPGKRSGKIPGNMLRYGLGSDSGKASGNTLGYDLGKQLG
jgi:hypothetical protein